MNRWLLSMIAAVMCLSAACSTFYGGVVTITKFADILRAEYARVYVTGVIPADIDARAEAADEAYVAALGSLEIALVEYETLKTPEAKLNVMRALAKTKEALTPILEIIGKHVGDGKYSKLATQLSTAIAP